MLDLDGGRRRPRRREAGIEIDRAPEGIRFEPLEDHPLLWASWSARTRSSRRTTPPSGSTGSSCTSRRTSCSSSRCTSGSSTRSRAARSSGGCSSSPSRGAASRVIEEYASASPELAGYSNAAVEIFVAATAPRSSTSRCRTSRARRGTSHRTTRASSATPSSTGSRPASARRRARCGSRTTSPARVRPRA